MCYTLTLQLLVAFNIYVFYKRKAQDIYKHKHLHMPITIQSLPRSQQTPRHKQSPMRIRKTGYDVSEQTYRNMNKKRSLVSWYFIITNI